MRESSTMPFLTGFLAGAACAALLDPRRGAARRALVRDKALSLARRAGREAVREGRGLRQRAQGLVHEARARANDQEVPDDVLVERVRAQLGRPVSHPRAIEVSACEGEVTLCGPILRGEAADLIDRVGRIRGVRSICNLLEVHDAPDVPSLQ